MNIQEIKIEKFPVVIFSDSHTQIANIEKIRQLHPRVPLISLGDFTYLFAKEGDKFNSLSIQYFLDHNIPTLEGNHESYIVASESDDKFTTQRVIGTTPNFNLSSEHLNFLSNLPRGFKLVLPDERNYYCFHNLPRDLWSFPDKITESEFKSNYIFNSKTLGVIQGHLHLNKIDNFSPKRYIIGKLCNTSHHQREDIGGHYLLLTKDNIEYKRL